MFDSKKYQDLTKIVGEGYNYSFELTPNFRTVHIIFIGGFYEKESFSIYASSSLFNLYWL